MFEQAFKNIDSVLHTDFGSATELDHVEQNSWILFLKYLDDLEATKKKEAALAGKKYNFILEPRYRWEAWACPEGTDGKLDHQKALEGDDLKDFVNLELFPYLKKFKAEESDTIEYKIGEIAFLFLQHFIKILKAGGKAGIVIKNTFLSNTDNASVSLRKLLLESCNLHTVLDLPGGAFAGAGVKTVVLFFDKGAPTKKVWFYQLNLARNLGKTNPLNEKDLTEFVELQKTKADSENSWSVDVKGIDQTTFDLSVKNPHKGEEMKLREPREILEEMRKLDEEGETILSKIEQ